MDMDAKSRTIDFTIAAWESFYDTVDDSKFEEYDAELIYRTLKRTLRMIPFCDYLKRYIYVKAEMQERFRDIPLSDFQEILVLAFRDNHTPASFSSSTVKLRAQAKNWLTQLTVRRRVVFLLGFGLKMTPEEVNQFLTKALGEESINSQDPFELACWYCYEHGFSYDKFSQLWKQYNKLTKDDLRALESFGNCSIHAGGGNNTAVSDMALLIRMVKLKNADNASLMSVSAREQFDVLYSKAKEIVANWFNESSEEEMKQQVAEYKSKLEDSGRLYDYEIAERLQTMKDRRKQFTAEDVTESDIEHVICSAIPLDRHGNLSPEKKSKLNAQFSGKRFSRQHIGRILAGSDEVNRYDLITLNFFIFSQMMDRYPDRKQRFLSFCDGTNEILDRCHMGKMYVTNPYECFVMMCMVSEDPMGTYADVWEMSYR